MLKKYLISPGPTAVPHEVLSELSKPVMHHRTEDFARIFAQAAQGLKPFFGTQEQVLILSSSGTGAMEAAFVNVLSPGDKVLIIDGGKFGARWAEIAVAYGIEAGSIKYDWGTPARAEDVAAYLKNNPDTKAVFMQGTETSAAVSHPVKEIAQVVKGYGALLIVDGITSVGVEEVLMDDWGIDILLSGSQKAFMLPPGLSFIAMSEKARENAQTSKLPKYYFNLLKEYNNQINNTTAWTSSVSLIYGLAKSLELMLSEGPENIYKRHALCAEATRAAGRALGLRQVAQASPSNAATGFYLPEGVDGKAFLDYMKSKLGVTMAGGQDHLKGKIVRVSHMGYHDFFDTVTAVSALEIALKAFGADINPGSGVAAAQSTLINNTQRAL